MLLIDQWCFPRICLWKSIIWIICESLSSCSERISCNLVLGIPDFLTFVCDSVGSLCSLLMEVGLEANWPMICFLCPVSHTNLCQIQKVWAWIICKSLVLHSERICCNLEIGVPLTSYIFICASEDPHSSFKEVDFLAKLLHLLY